MAAPLLSAAMNQWWPGQLMHTRAPTAKKTNPHDSHKWVLLLKALALQETALPTVTAELPVSQPISGFEFILLMHRAALAQISYI